MMILPDDLGGRSCRTILRTTVPNIPAVDATAIAIRAWHSALIPTRHRNEKCSKYASCLFVLRRPVSCLRSARPRQSGARAGRDVRRRFGDREEPAHEVQVVCRVDGQAKGRPGQPVRRDGFDRNETAVATQERRDVLAVVRVGREIGCQQQRVGRNRFDRGAGGQSGFDDVIGAGPRTRWSRVRRGASRSTAGLSAVARITVDSPSVDTTSANRPSTSTSEPRNTTMPSRSPCCSRQSSSGRVSGGQHDRQTRRRAQALHAVLENRTARQIGQHFAGQAGRSHSRLQDDRRPAVGSSRAVSSGSLPAAPLSRPGDPDQHQGEVVLSRHHERRTRVKRILDRRLRRRTAAALTRPQ